MKKTTSEFNNSFTNITLKLVRKIQKSSQPFESYLDNVSSEMENKSRSINDAFCL